MLSIGYNNVRLPLLPGSELRLPVAWLPEQAPAGHSRLLLPLAEWSAMAPLPEPGTVLQLWANDLPLTQLWIKQISLKGDAIELLACNRLQWLHHQLHRPLAQLGLYGQWPFAGPGNGSDCMGYYAATSMADLGFTFPLLVANSFHDPSHLGAAENFQSLSFLDIAPAFHLQYLLLKLLEKAGLQLPDDDGLAEALADLVMPWRGSRPFRYNWQQLGACAIAQAAGSSLTIDQLLPLGAEVTGLPADTRAWKYEAPVTAFYTANAQLTIVNTGGGVLEGQVQLRALHADSNFSYAAQSREIFLDVGESTTLDLDFQENLAGGALIQLVVIDYAGTFADWALSRQLSVSLPQEAFYLPLNQHLPAITGAELLQQFLFTFNRVMLPGALPDQVHSLPLDHWLNQLPGLNEPIVAFSKPDPPLPLAPLFDAGDVLQTLRPDVPVRTLPFAGTAFKTYQFPAVNGTGFYQLQVPALLKESGLRLGPSQAFAQFSFAPRWLKVGSLWQVDGLDLEFAVNDQGTWLRQLEAAPQLAPDALQALHRRQLTLPMQAVLAYSVLDLPGLVQRGAFVGPLHAALAELVIHAEGGEGPGISSTSSHLPVTLHLLACAEG